MDDLLFNLKDYPTLQINIPENKNYPVILGIFLDEEADHYASRFEDIIKAIQRDPVKDVWIVKLSEIQQNLNEILPYIHFIMLLGIDPQKTGLPLPYDKYKIFRFNTFSVLCTDSLKDIFEIQEKKKMLWNALKTEFL
jgi:hypothetical protein